ncbi:MAG TPA: type I-U CRISPR-associated helicase/endonuclease Cas3 [Bryobacteraceae bacterium]|nr:type I-U CRISPR-associated helicase/endonuclease Cas3 [Bryobacteraceae bacterium]
MNRAEAKSLLREALALGPEESPFSWQDKLLEQMLRGDIPEVIDIPTGLGKTSVMAIWLVARACGAKIPRRLVYVVDRRAVVDQATEEAVRLREWADKDGTLRDQLGLNDRSLPVSTLRGQYVDNREWLDDPSAPAIIVGTVDMIGSRLLFQGYGVSRKMRPYHAGLLGADSLVVLDEAHLVPPFEHLLRAITTDSGFRPTNERCQRLIPPFKLTALSATARTQEKKVFGLSDEDLRHPEVRKRLNAKKSLRIQLLDENDKLHDALAQHAWKLSEEGKAAARILLYCDSREVAQKAKEALEKLARSGKKQIETELFVGGRRVFEREKAKERLRSLGFIAGSKVDWSSPAFLFATSAGEVGVDLDADHMVCDLVAWERMVQRLGRVNRRGDGEATVVVIVEREADKRTEQALNKQKRGENLTNKERELVAKFQRKQSVRGLIEHLPKHDGGSYDASPGALRDLKTRASTEEALQKILDHATTPEPLRPALTRPLVEAWAMTSLEKHTGRPAIHPWLRGWGDDPPQTALVWRSHLPVRGGGATPSKKEIEAFFEAAPVHTSEILETETFRVTEWITARAKRLRQQQRQENSHGQPLHDQDVVAFAFDADGGLRKAFTLAEIVELRDNEELEKSLVGATVVLDARLGGLKEGLLDHGEDTLPRTADDGHLWLAEGVVGFRVRRAEASAGVPLEKNWRERLRFASTMTDEGEATEWLIVEKWQHAAATEEDRSAAKPQHLDEHQSWTEQRARRLAQALHLDPAVVEALTLAARLHDEGKRAQRWQRAFHAPKDGIYAKTDGPIDYRLLDGYRHELGSVLHVENDERILKLPEEYRDLVLHLIAAHHGFARPLIGTGGCQGAPPSVLEEKVAEIALRFARLQMRWGPWGLAWWEALLRAADQQASRDNEAPARGGGA